MLHCGSGARAGRAPLRLAANERKKISQIALKEKSTHSEMLRAARAGALVFSLFCPFALRRCQR